MTQAILKGNYVAGEKITFPVSPSTGDRAIPLAIEGLTTQIAIVRDMLEKLATRLEPVTNFTYYEAPGPDASAPQVSPKSFGSKLAETIAEL